MQGFDLSDLEEFRLLLKKDHTTHILLMKDHVDNLTEHLKLIESERQIEKEIRIIRLDNSVIKKLELREKVKDLQIQLHKASLGDDKIIRKAFRGYAREIGLMRGRSGVEALEILDGKVFDLRKKRDNLRYVIRMRKADHKRVLEQISRVPKCQINPSLTERRRKLEYVLQRSSARLGEARQMRKRYKAIRSLLREEMVTLPKKVEVMELVRKKQISVIKDVIKKQRIAEKRRSKIKTQVLAAEVKAITARQERDRSMYEYCQVKEQRIAFLRHEAMRKEEEVVYPDIKGLVMQLRKLKDAKQENLDFYAAVFYAIKKTTLVTDIRQARHRMITQRRVWENLREVRLKAEASMKIAATELKKYQRNLDIIRGKELHSPLNLLAMEVTFYENILQEETIKRNTTLKRLHENKVSLAALKTMVWHILQLLELHMASEIEKIKFPRNLPIHVLFLRVDQLLEKLLKTLEDIVLPALRKKMREAELQKKIEEQEETDKFQPAPRPITSFDDDFGSDDEHNKRRIHIKKEAILFAELKKRQRARKQQAGKM